MAEDDEWNDKDLTAYADAVEWKVWCHPGKFTDDDFIVDKLLGPMMLSEWKAAKKEGRKPKDPELLAQEWYEAFTETKTKDCPAT